MINLHKQFKLKGATLERRYLRVNLELTSLTCEDNFDHIVHSCPDKKKGRLCTSTDVE